MVLEFSYHPYTLEFIKPAQTSRNVFEQRHIFIIRLELNGYVGYGEAGALSMLSVDDIPDYEKKLIQIGTEFAHSQQIIPEWTHTCPSMVFGLETAWNHLNWQLKARSSGFPEHHQFPIPINGLVWMQDAEGMLAESLNLVRNGYRCIKFKVGALDFDEECRMLEKFRTEVRNISIRIRLDANGAFHPSEVEEQLKELRRFEIHSIEQPLKPIFRDELARLARKKLLPIALDESLIGISIDLESDELIREIKPSYLVLKPSLHGGFGQCEHWISLAEKNNIGYWITSALESNIGLYSIALFAAPKAGGFEQGLGTGSLYRNNFTSPLKAEGGWLHCLHDVDWDLPF